MVGRRTNVPVFEKATNLKRSCVPERPLATVGPHFGVHKHVFLILETYVNDAKDAFRVLIENAPGPRVMDLLF